jgi:hypothetical protein
MIVGPGLYEFPFKEVTGFWKGCPAERPNSGRTRRSASTAASCLAHWATELFSFPGAGPGTPAVRAHARTIAGKAPPYSSTVSASSEHSLLY